MEVLNAPAAIQDNSSAVSTHYIVPSADVPDPKTQPRHLTLLKIPLCAEVSSYVSRMLSYFYHGSVAKIFFKFLLLLLKHLLPVPCTKCGERKTSYS